MIPSADQTTRTVASTMDGEDVVMGIDDSDMGHIMSILSSGLYADPVLAAMREYSTNARDSHVEAGQERPIEVTLPNRMHPTFTVRDWGVGLSAEEIRTIYARYGASTKRESNDAVGMLGLGCKSALGYTDQFTVIGWKDGVKTVTSVARDELGRGGMKILSEEEDDGETGVLISIPADASEDWEGTAEEIFRFWPEGSVLVNGEEPDAIEGFELTDELLVVQDGLGTDLIVMGNVPYPAELDRSRGKLVATVPIGSVHFTPSREALQDTPLTRETIASIQDAFDEAAAEAVQRVVDEADSPPAALRAAVEASQALGNSPSVAKLNGQPLPDAITHAGRNTFKPAKRWGNGGKLRTVPQSTPYYNAGSHDNTDEIDPHIAVRAGWIVNHQNKVWTKATRERLDFYLESKGITQRPWIITRRTYAPMRHWTDGPVLDWDDVLAVRMPRKDYGGGSEKVAGTYRVREAWRGGDGWHDVPDDSLDTEHLIAWLRTDEKHAGILLRKIAPKATIVELTANRREKFLRMYPKAEDAWDAISRLARIRWNRLGEETRLAAAWATRESPWNDPDWSSLRWDRVNDPELSRIVRAATARQDHFFADHAGYAPKDETQPLIRDLKVAEVTERYPLLADTGSANQEHIEQYVNAVYERNK